jgi:hypothetical protein
VSSTARIEHRSHRAPLASSTARIEHRSYRAVSSTARIEDRSHRAPLVSKTARIEHRFNQKPAANSTFTCTAFKVCTNERRTTYLKVNINTPEFVAKLLTEPFGQPTFVHTETSSNIQSCVKKPAWEWISPQVHQQ